VAWRVSPSSFTRPNTPRAAGDARDSTQGTDFWATSHNYVSMTPLQVDMTNYGMLDTVRAWCNSFQS